MPRILVIGGGISGLTLAYRLEQRLPTAEVLVLERDTRVGGTIATVERDGFRVEAGPNGFLDNKPFVAAFCRELGLGDRMLLASVAAGRNRFLMQRGQLRQRLWRNSESARTARFRVEAEKRLLWKGGEGQRCHLRVGRNGIGFHIPVVQSVRSRHSDAPNRGNE